MEEIKPLCLKDREIIKKYLYENGGMGSESSFTSLYLWRNMYNYRYAVFNDCLVIFLNDREGKPGMYFPYGKGDRISAAKRACEEMKKMGGKMQFYSVTEDVLEYITKNTDEYRVVGKEFCSDYVYLSEKLATLSGKALHSKKNHFNRFLKKYNWEYERIKATDCEEIISAYKSWGTDFDKYLSAEFDALPEIIRNTESFGVGGMIRIDGVIKAFTIGEKLPNGTAVVPVEKADKSVDGAYTAINKMFVQNELSDCVYINREDDCGLENLKKAKLSYKPAFMVDKYRIEKIK